MDNFRRSKRTTSKSSMDGLIRTRMRRPVGTNSSVRQPADSERQESKKTRSSRIGDFSRPEGFIARKTKPIQPDGSMLGRRTSQVQKPSLSADKPVAIKNNKKRRARKKRNYKKIIIRTIIMLAVVVFIVGGYVGLKGFIRARQVFKGGGHALAWDCHPDPSLLKGEGDGRVNILLLGKGGPEQDDGPDLTDTIILASVDPCNNDAGLLSIPRDLAVRMDSGETVKINAVYALTKMSAESSGESIDSAEESGIKAIEKTVENVTGVSVHYHVMVDFTAFEKAVDAVGGVDIDVKVPVYERMRLNNKDYILDVEVGQQHFDGLRALAYSRSRYTSARGDFDRSERQRELIVGLRSKIMSAGTYSNPLKIAQLIDSFGTRVRTNLNIPDDATKLYSLGQDIDESSIQSVSLVDEPNVLITDGHHPTLGSMQIPTAGIYRYDEIRAFVRTTFKDSFIRKEDPKIAVLNGTTIDGLATLKADDLKSYGYDVISVGDAPDKNIPYTTLVDLRGGEENKYTRRYLELRFKTAAVSVLPEGIVPPETADFVIILGQNEASN